MIKSSFFQDHSQNFWQLGSIQTASVGFTGLVLGGQLSTQFGAPTALLSIAVGNLILWVVGMAIISMSVSKRNNAIENFSKYFGQTSGVLASIILIVAFILWYVLQIELATTAFDNIYQSYTDSTNSPFATGIGLGIFVALLSVGGIRFIKWICAIGFLFLLCFAIYVFVYFEGIPSFQGNWGLSASAVSTTIAATLVGMINLPTFFKHSRSKSDSFLGLTFMTIFTTALQSSSVWLRYDLISANLIKFMQSGFNFYFITFFIFTSLICINIVNIYFASAGAETIMSRIIKRPIPRYLEYVGIGLVGTVIYVCTGVSAPLLILVNLAADFLASLGITLVLAFLVSIVIKHRMRPLEQSINNGCWFIGCLVSLIMQIHNPQDTSSPFIWGIASSVCAFLIAAFIAETTWSLREIRAKKTV